MNLKKRALQILPHVSIVMSGMMIVFFLIDRVNQPMGFMTNEFHRWLSFFLALFCVGYSVAVIAGQRRRERNEERRRRRAQQQSGRTAPARKAAAQGGRVEAKAREMG